MSDQVNNEEVLDSYQFGKWSQLKPVEPGAGSFYGDYFPEGVKYHYKVRQVVASKNKETGKVRINVDAVCIGGPDKAANFVGNTLKSSFTMPLDSEVDDEKKNFGARMFLTFQIACGLAPQDGKKIKPADFTNKEFVATTKDYVTKESKKMQPDGSFKVYPSITTSQIKDIFPVDGGISPMNSGFDNFK